MNYYSKTLKRNQIKTYRTIKKYKLNTEIKLERVNYCNFYLNLNSNQQLNLFNIFVFTDESTFDNDLKNSYTRSTGGRNSDESNYQFSPVLRKFKCNFYGILSKYSFTLVRIIGNFTKLKFRTMMINQNVLNYIKAVGGGHPYLIQDNSNLHEFEEDYSTTLMEECRERERNQSC